MATRYCGKVKIGCTYRDRENDYRCTMSAGGKRIGVEYVGAPRHLTHAVDSPKAYDDAAHAALSFASSEGKLDERDLDFTDSGYRIRRASGRR